MIVGNLCRKSRELSKSVIYILRVIWRKYRPDKVLERASISQGRACKWKTFAFRDDDKYCIERRHAIFIVVAERYGRREKIYPGHLEVPIQHRRDLSIEASVWVSRNS